MMKYLCYMLAMASCFAVTPEEAKQALVEGNRRFVEDKYFDKFHRVDRLKTIQVQEPIAIIVCCSDSRVPPEVLFDQSIGCLFVVRVAGNVIGPLELESILYAVDILHSPYLLVYGHQNCGAVNAVFTGEDQGIPAIAKQILPAVQLAKQRQKNLESAIKFNAQNSAVQLKKNALIADKIAKKVLQIDAAIYAFETGKVELLPL